MWVLAFDARGGSAKGNPGRLIAEDGAVTEIYELPYPELVLTGRAAASATAYVSRCQLAGSALELVSIPRGVAQRLRYGDGPPSQTYARLDPSARRRPPRLAEATLDAVSHGVYLGGSDILVRLSLGTCLVATLTRLKTFTVAIHETSPPAPSRHSVAPSRPRSRQVRGRSGR